MVRGNPAAEEGTVGELTMQDFEKRRTIRRLWLERPPERRTSRDLMIFHEWLAENLPTLLPHGNQPFEEFLSEMGDLVEERAS